MNATCLKLSPLLIPCICPFLRIFIASYPCNVRQAVSNEKKPMPGLTRRLMNRWSCSGTAITPLEVVSRGNRILHAVDQDVVYKGVQALCVIDLSSCYAIIRSEGRSIEERPGKCCYAHLCQRRSSPPRSLTDIPKLEYGAAFLRGEIEAADATVDGYLEAPSSCACWFDVAWHQLSPAASDLVGPGYA